MTDATPPQSDPQQPTTPPQPGYVPPQQPYAAAAPLSQADDRQWASFAHLGGILGFLPSLIIWLVFKDRGAFTNQEAKEALNFQITALIGYLACTVLGAILSIIFIGLLFYLVQFAIWVVAIIFSIQGFLKAKDGVAYRYPFALRLIK